MNKRLIIKRISYGILLVSITLWFYRYNEKNNLFELKNIDISGNNYISIEEIMDSIILNTEASLFSLNIQKIKNNLEKNPFIKTVYIGREIPDKLIIKIIERTPIALIIQEENIFFIDYDNFSLPVNSKTINAFPVPILNIDKKNKNTSISIIKYLYKNYNSMYNNTSEIVESGSKITLVTDYNTKIFINPNMPINNILKLKNFEQTIRMNNQIYDYKYIDLIYKNQIVAKKRIYS